MFKKTVVIILSLMMLAGCSLGSSNSEPISVQQQLNVVYYDESSFFQEYGMLFSALNTDISINVIPLNSIYKNAQNDEVFDYNKAYLDFIEKENPDLIILDSDKFKKLADENKLANLDSYLSKSKLDIEGFVPGLIDYIKELGNGNLYGLATQFNSQVLYYNKDLFDKYNVPYPTDKMTWGEIFQRARQFPTEGDPKDRIYGLRFGYSKDLFELAMQVGDTEQLQLLNTSQNELSITSSLWSNVFHIVRDVMDADALFYEQDRYTMYESDGEVVAMSMNDRYSSDPFLGGKLAMSLNGSYYLDEIKRASENLDVDDQLLKNWDIVTAPVSSQNPDIGAGVTIYDILAIPAEAANMDAAWKLIEYLSSDEYARVNSLSSSSGYLPVRKNYIQGDGTYNYEALYTLKPFDSKLYRNWENISQEFYTNFYSYALEEMQKVTKKEADVDEALAQIKVKGEQMLQVNGDQDKSFNANTADEVDEKAETTN